MRRNGKFQLGTVLTISLAHMVHDIYSAFLAPILPLLIEKFSLSLSLAGLLTVIMRLPSILNPVIGLLADKISMRYLIIIAPALTAICMSLMGLAPGYGVLVAICLITGVSVTLFHVPTPVMIRRVSGDQVGKGMSFYMVGGELARSIGPVVILAAVSWWTLEGTYRLIPFGLAASFLLFLRVHSIRISEDIKKSGDKTSLRGTMRRYLPFFLLLAGITLLRGFMKAALTSFLPTYLNLVKHESLWFSGISLSIIQLAVSAGTFSAGVISDRVGRKTTLLVISIATPACMALFMIAEGMWVFPLLLLMGITMAATTPVFLAMVQELESDRPAFLNSIFMTISFLLTALDVAAVGILGDIIGLEKTYWVSILLAAAAIPIILKIPAEPSKS